MSNRITKEQGALYKRQWEAVREADLARLTSMSPDQKLRQLANLMASAKAMGWSESLAAEDAEVRERWNKLRRVYIDRTHESD